MREKTTVNGKRKKAPVCVVILYVCAALSLICAGFMLYYSITYVQSYYESYGMSMSEGITDVMQYVISGAGTYMGFAVLFWAAGLILTKLKGREPEAAVLKSEGISMEELEEQTMAQKEEFPQESGDGEAAEAPQDAPGEEEQQAVEDEEKEESKQE